MVELRINRARPVPPANKVWGKVVFSQASVIPSVHGMVGGVCIYGESASREGLHPGWVCIGGGGKDRPPPPHRILQDTVNERAVRIILECILVCRVLSEPIKTASVRLQLLEPV